MSLADPKTPGVVTLRYVVMSILNRLANYSMRDYYRLMQIAIEGFGELNLWHLDSIEVVYLRMNNAKIVRLPADFVDWLKIGVPINGKLRVLTRHDKMLLPREFEDGSPVGNTDAGEPSTPTAENLIFFSDHFRRGMFVAGLFGMPGGIDQAYYRVDKETRTIAFSGSVPRSEIVLEYISTGVRATGGTMVPREAVGALRAYVMFAMLDGDNRTAMNEKLRREDIYDKEVSALRSFLGTFTKEEYQRMLWTTSRQTPKR